MSLSHIILAFLLNLFLIIGNVAFAGKSCDIYLVETKMLDLPQRLFVHNQRVLIHQGLRFVDKEGEVECHFTPKGLQTCGKDCYITNDNEPAKYLKTKGIAKNHPSSKKDLVQWCQNWAKGKKYILTGQNCWKLVGDFCKSHNIKCPATEDRNTALDVSGVGGLSRGCADGISALKDGEVLEGVAHLATAPMRGVVEGLDSTVKCFEKLLK